MNVRKAKTVVFNTVIFTVVIGGLGWGIHSDNVDRDKTEQSLCAPAKMVDRFHLDDDKNWIAVCRQPDGKLTISKR